MLNSTGLLIDSSTLENYFPVAKKMSFDIETTSAAAQLVIANCSLEVIGSINSSQATSDVQKVVKVFVLDFPFALVCFTVFTIYACLWDRQRVHGWILMAISASFGLRALSIGFRDFAIEVIGWKIIDDAPGFCVFLGKTPERVYHRMF